MWCLLQTRMSSTRTYFFDVYFDKINFAINERGLFNVKIDQSFERTQKIVEVANVAILLICLCIFMTKYVLAKHANVI